MRNNIPKKISSIPPHITIIAALAVAVAVSGAALFFSRSEPKAGAEAVTRAARVERVEGSVGVAHAFDDTEASELDWRDATVNTPLSSGDRIYTNEGSRATVAFTGRNYARLDPGASLDVLTLADRRTQLALRGGSAIFDLGELSEGELFEVATPHGAIDFNEPGLYQIGYGDSGSTMISVLSGLAQVVGLAGSGEISTGEVLTLAGQAAAQILTSRLAPDLAGGIVDDYYDDRYGDSYDGRYRDYDAYVDDPDYYDPYRRSTSYSQLSSYDAPGVYDLDRYGDWVDVDGHGQCWSPRVDASWAPYRDGSWYTDDYWGPTWVSDEPWGWAPYHYGRWAHVNNRQWVWVPDRAVSRPAYSPALVAFIPITRTNQIGWVPLAPGERYASRYYDRDFRPHYYGGGHESWRAQRAFANLGVPQAVTVVPFRQFSHAIEPGFVSQVNPQLLADSQPVFDAFTVESLRETARSEKQLRKMRKNQFRQEAFNTPVITSTAPMILPGRERMAQALQVTPVSEKQKRNKLKFDDSGQVIALRRPDGLPQSAAQGDKAARREMRRLQRQQPAVATVEPRGGQQVTADLSRKERRVQRRLERQQGVTVEQRGQAVNAEQMRNERRAQKRQQRLSVGQSAPVAPAQQQRLERKAQRRLERQQRGVVEQRAPVAVPQQQRPQQQRLERKTQKRAERQQRMSSVQRVQQTPAWQSSGRAQVDVSRQQRKAQKRAERVQMRQQQPAVIQQQQQNQRRQVTQIQQPVERNREVRRQQKMERRAARQQAAPQQVAVPNVSRGGSVNQRVQLQGPPVNSDSSRKAARKTERAARGKQ